MNIMYTPRSSILCILLYAQCPTYLSYSLMPAIISHKTSNQLNLCHPRYDSSSVGRITAEEFCAALSDLGVSTTTPREALDLADRFKAAAGIPYVTVICRTTISTLLL